MNKMLKNMLTTVVIFAVTAGVVWLLKQ